MTRIELMVRMLTCADARIAFEQAGLRPTPEVVEGRDTGRVAHLVEKDSVVLHFEEGGYETVDFGGSTPYGRLG